MLISTVSLSSETLKTVRSKFKLSNFSFIMRSTIKHSILYTCNKIAATLEETSKLKLVTETIDGKNGDFYVKRVGDLINIALIYTETENKVPISNYAVTKLLKEMANEEKFDGLIEKYSDINKFDPLHEADRNLDETKKIVIESLEEVMKRGEELEDMDENLSRLGSMTKEFYKKAKQQNKCCRFF